LHERVHPLRRCPRHEALRRRRAPAAPLARAGRRDVIHGGPLMRSTRFIPTALALGAAALSAREARAADCTTLGLPSPAYLTGPTATGPVIQKIGKFLAVQSPPITLVYAASGSCTGVASSVAAVTDPTKAALVTPSGKTNYFMYWDSTGTTQTCDIL